MPVLIRAAAEGDLVVLREIERATGQRDRDFGLDDVADDQPPSIEALAGYVEGGRAWVAIDTDGVPLGYLLVDTVDGATHIEQVSVVPDHQGRGPRRALIDKAAEWARPRQSLAHGGWPRTSGASSVSSTRRAQVSPANNSS